MAEANVIEFTSQEIKRIEELEDRAVKRVNYAYNASLTRKHDLICAYSGGKDSDIILAMALLARERSEGRVQFRVEHNFTTLDAPDTVYFIRDRFKYLGSIGVPVKINYPENDVSGWALIGKSQMPPTRLARYCCDILKEREFEGQDILLGVRRAESTSRQSRGTHELLHKDPAKRIAYMEGTDDEYKLSDMCMSRRRFTTNPIIDWEDKDVWNYIAYKNIVVNPLYAKGFKRVGCVGCPLAGKHRFVEFERFPVFRDNYIRAFDKLLEHRKALGKETAENWKTGLDVFKWWMQGGQIPGQEGLDDIDAIFNE